MAGGSEASARVLDARGDACGSLLEAIDATWQALAVGGVWISIGPLEYNGTDGGHMGDGMRLCGDELLLLIASRGFEVVEVREVPCAYTQDQRSMLKQHFDCLFFVARKIAKAANEKEPAAPASNKVRVKEGAHPAGHMPRSRTQSRGA